MCITAAASHLSGFLKKSGCSDLLSITDKESGDTAAEPDSRALPSLPSNRWFNTGTKFDKSWWHNFWLDGPNIQKSAKNCRKWVSNNTNDKPSPLLFNLMIFSAQKTLQWFPEKEIQPSNSPELSLEISWRLQMKNGGSARSTNLPWTQLNLD